MNSINRFQDENLKLSDLYDEVWVVCPGCAKKAIAKRYAEEKIARLFCMHCGHNKKVSTAFGKNGSIAMAANVFFDSGLWLTATFRNEVFWAYNATHLEYLARYIGASLREHKDRTHFTLLEKLPRFYHEAKNRDGLLKVIEKLRSKT